MDKLTSNNFDNTSLYDITTYSCDTSAIIESKDWLRIFDHVQLSVTVVGLVANMITVITLFKCRRRFSPLIIVLLQHQTAVDVLVCSQAIALLTQPPGWTTGCYIFDVIVCQTWHSQTFYWGAVNVSIWNLVLLAVERFLAVVYPFFHQRISVSKIIYAIIAVDFLVMVVLMGPSYFQTKFIDGSCQAVYYFPGDTFEKIMFSYSVVIFFFTYAIPCTLFFIMYGTVIVSLKRRHHQSDKLGKSKIIAKANAELTKTAIAVTVFFIISLGFDLWYYVLGYTGITKYVLNSPMQKVADL